MDSSGHVGIGTTNPGTRLEIANGTDNGLTEDLEHIRLTNNDPSLDTGDRWGIRWYQRGAEVAGIDMAYDGSSLDTVFDGYAGGFKPGLMVIKGNGRVGIGTMSPAAKLDVSGDIKASGTISGENLSRTIWTTGTSGSYNLRTIFDDARNAGLNPGVYDCVLRTNNEAHWTGRRFTASVNYYIANPAWPHQFHNDLNIEAMPAGCNGGMSQFNGNTGNFDFNSGNCSQSIRLVCHRLD